ncbi:MAG: hypothetical protein IKG03_06235 [Clostridiales bacterium]|nr:hypothetical protein [Clostridiales bacterium]
MKKTKIEKTVSNIDDAIENVASFEEAKAIINTRLNHLCADLTDCSDMEDKYFKEICKAYDDKKMSFMDLYAGFYAPCKVSDPLFLPKGQGDMNDVMINFSEGFNEFIASMEEQYVTCLIRRRRATILLSKMLSIQLPYSRLMYLYYYKKQDVSEISESLYISRATFYRLKSVAINTLTGLYFPPRDTGTDGHGGKAG